MVNGRCDGNDLKESNGKSGVETIITKKKNSLQGLSSRFDLEGKQIIDFQDLTRKLQIDIISECTVFPPK